MERSKDVLKTEIQVIQKITSTRPYIIKTKICEKYRLFEANNSFSGWDTRVRVEVLLDQRNSLFFNVNDKLVDLFLLV